MTTPHEPETSSINEGDESSAELQSDMVLDRAADATEASHESHPESHAADEPIAVEETAPAVETAIEEVAVTDQAEAVREASAIEEAATSFEVVVAGYDLEAIAAGVTTCEIAASPETTGANEEVAAEESLASADGAKPEETDASTTTSEVQLADTGADKSSENKAENKDATKSKNAEETFADFALSKPVKRAVEEAGYSKPTSVQAKLIPLMLEGRDVIAQSQTGTGKTAAFALPILSQLNTKMRMPQVLVLAPTRELATQVAESFETYGKNISKLRILSIYGGTDYEGQLRGLKRGAQIIVGTPGRVIDHIKRGSLQLDALNCVVLDEADEMLNMGFQEDVEFILEQTPEEKQMTLFSATMPDAIRQIAEDHLIEPARITIRRKQLTAESVEQRCVFVESGNKLELLSRILEVEETDGVIVFTKTKDSTVSVSEKLSARGIRAAALNGDLPQARRQRTVDQIKAGKIDVLVATDVAARGLDVQRISHVINFDLPHDSESYIHRIGRTGRAGREGIAYIFLTERQRGKLRLIERATKKAIAVVDPPSTEQLVASRISAFKETVLTHLGSDDSQLYASILKDLAEESGQDLEDIACGLAHMARRGRPLIAKALPEPERNSRGRRDDRRDGRRGERGDRQRGDRGRRGESFGRVDRSKPPAPGMTRFWIGVGHEDEVRPGNIVGAVANEAGISGSDIGPIHIYTNFSTIDLPDAAAKHAIKTLQNTRVAGKQLRIRPFEERPSKAKRGFSNDRRSEGDRTDRRGKDHRSKDRKDRRPKQNHVPDPVETARGQDSSDGPKRFKKGGKSKFQASKKSGKFQPKKGFKKKPGKKKG
ncbi:MAG: DEAD/DEAH box helicase [Planctomycetota bacterium]